MKKLGIYIHIPFCKQKCFYCDFVSYANQDKYFQKYVQALNKEINNFIDNNEFEVQTIYIGGGTPSLIDAKYIEEILHIFEKRNLLKEVKEVTIEVNPGTVTEEKLRNYKYWTSKYRR